MKLAYLNLVTARKQGDSYTFSQRIKADDKAESTDAIVLPAGIKQASMSLSSTEMVARIEVTNSSLEAIESDEATWLPIGRCVESEFRELPRCQAIRFTVESGDLLIEIYAA